jgi:hypothetical protein
VVTDVPEPVSWAMLLLGFERIGFVAYSRKLKPACISSEFSAISFLRKSHPRAAALGGPFLLFFGNRAKRIATGSQMLEVRPLANLLYRSHYRLAR